jgi:hypothetical protein
MDFNPNKELVDDLKAHLGWRWLEGWMKLKQEGIKSQLLKAKDIDEVKKLQTEYDTYLTIQSKVNNFKEHS